MNALSDCFTLQNGVKMPCIGYGTFKMEDDAAERTVREAIARGYRHIDTASVYGNETGVGRAVRACGVPREDLSITSKLWNDDQGYESTLKAFDATLSRLGLDYVDLYLIHWPAPLRIRDRFIEYNRETWRAFEKLYREGKIRAIGVSNFLEKHLVPLMEAAEVKPMVNQLEIHPAFPQREIVDFCKQHGIVVEAWGPLMRGKAFDNPLLCELAEKYRKSVAQILVRWCVQYGVVPLPKTQNPERMKQNAEIFDFSLSEEDVSRMCALEALGRTGQDPEKNPF
ncbi:MAG: aldo/keto reductase [Oscillospiraceae bacterium]|jgi:diketogulonate reductase-like aldo/keto reductase